MNCSKVQGAPRSNLSSAKQQKHTSCKSPGADLSTSLCEKEASEGSQVDRNNKAPLARQGATGMGNLAGGKAATCSW